MANQWLRLWHDMPNDPKWRTIARVSKQPITAVIAVYIHILVNASNATERGRTQNVCHEDLASALDLDTEQVDAIISAMQGRVLDGDMVSGWSKRQVEREDGSAERSKRWREAQKEINRTQPNATERNRTPDTDTDTDTELNTIDTNVSIVVNGETIPDCPHQEIISLYKKNIPMGIQPKAWDGARAAALKSRWRERKERQNLAWWDKFFDYVSQSKFLTGQVVAKDRKPFEITLPWLLKPENFNKIIEGYYHR